jgi:hypothetical protein
MAELPYRFFINPFLVVTGHSYKLLLTIGEDHKAKLTAMMADPDIAAILLTYDPVLQAYKNTDQNLQSALGTYKGKTQTVEESFDALTHEMLPQWEGKIRSVYFEGTAEETAFFPQKRRVFQGGTYEQRISAIKVLGDRCALDANPVVSGLSVGILAFHTQIESARVLQQSQGEGAVANLRTLRETARVLLCEELFGNMCLLLHKHRHKPTDVAQYFEMKYLRSSTEATSELEIDAQGVENILDNIEPADIISGELKNTSRENVTVQLYYAPGISDLPQPGDKIFELHPGVKKLFAEMDLGVRKAFLNVYNNNAEHLGTVELSGDLAQGGRGLAN